MKKIRNIFLLIYFLSSSISWGQCVDVKFSSTTNPANAYPGLPQRVCLAQCTTGTCTAVTVYATVTSGTISSANWVVIGDAAANIIKSNENTTYCTFEAKVGSAPFDWGKARVAYRYEMSGTSCGCIDTLDFYKQIAPPLLVNPINGPTCLGLNQDATFYVDPIFSRNANVQLGFGIDGYTWKLKNAGSASVIPTDGWTYQSPSGVSGDGSAIYVNSGGTACSPCTLEVTQGNTCNSTPITLLINTTSTNQATIKPTSIDAAYSGLTDATPFVNGNACLKAGTGNTPVTLEAPSGATYLWNLPTGFSYGTGSSTSQTITVNASGNRSGIISVQVTPSNGCNITVATLNIKRVLSSSNTITPTTPTCLQPSTSPTYTISNFPPDGTSSFEIVPLSGTSDITVGSINSSGQFTVTVGSSPTVTGSFSLQAREVSGYACSGNSATLSGLTIPGPGSKDFQLVRWATWPTTSGSGAGKRTLYWNETSISPANSSTIPGDITWPSELGGSCDENSFTYDWRFDGYINSVQYVNATPTTTVSGQPTPFSSTTPSVSAALRTGVQYGTVSNPNCTITCTLTSTSSCDGSTYECFRLTRSASFTGPFTPSSRPGPGIGDPSTKSYSSNKELLLIQPNPNKGYFVVVIPDDFEGGELKILDNNGKLVSRFKNIEIETRVSLTGLSSGRYQVIASFEKDAITSPLIIE